MKQVFDDREFRPFRAAIFDLDGTLVHSEHAWEAAKISVLAHHGRRPSQALLDAHVGRGLNGFLDEAFEETLLPDKRAAIAHEIGAIADDLLPRMREPIAGAADCLQSLHLSGLRIAICSSSPRRHIKGALDMLNIGNLVDTIVSAAELPKGKPDPLPYQETLRALTLDATDVCAFEDSLPGAQSAASAGICVFAVGPGCTEPKFSFCHRQSESFAALSSLVPATP
ncbi:HAD family phosphatase [uncultured Roseobacter sp.]|uniref:HAD family hydrolase n=1 Tax=uncultured Roseobacter sp. TaxID=114847 RepID=UPI002605918E|nr:HAD family phosphatase [uncultured Roseobacter sp.]